MPEAISCAILRGTGELEALAPEWRELWRDDGNATPFQSPEWLLPWWHAFQQPDLRAVVLRKGRKLLALLPFYLYLEPGSGERKLLLIGAGTSDYLDGIYAGDCTAEDVRFGVDVLLAEPGWNKLDVTQLRRNSLLFQALDGMNSRSVERFRSGPAWCMAAMPMEQLPVKIRRNAMYYRNRAQRAGELIFRVAGRENCTKVFAELVHLHTSRWQAEGERGVLADPQVLAMHTEAVPLLEAAGLLRLCSLELNGEAIGIFYSLIDTPERALRRQYLYLPGFSLKHSDLRPGTLLLAMLSEHAAEEGIEVLDMLRGDEGYKQHWHVEPAETFGFSVSPLAPRRPEQHVAEMFA